MPVEKMTKLQTHFGRWNLWNRQLIKCKNLQYHWRKSRRD